MLLLSVQNTKQNLQAQKKHYKFFWNKFKQALSFIKFISANTKFFIRIIRTCFQNWFQIFYASFITQNLGFPILFLKGSFAKTNFTGIKEASLTPRLKTYETFLLRC